MAIDREVLRATLLSWRILGLAVMAVVSLVMFAIYGNNGFLSIPAVAAIMLPVEIVRGYRRRLTEAEAEGVPVRGKASRRK